MENIPGKAYRRFLNYLTPLIFITASYNKNIHHYEYMILAALGSFISSFLRRKIAYVLFIFLYLVSIYRSNLYFLAYGVAASLAYDSKIILSEHKNHLQLIAFKTEIIGLFISQCFELSPLIKLMMFSVLITVYSLTKLPPCESIDPIEDMKSLFSDLKRNTTVIIGSNKVPKTTEIDIKHSKLLCKEYKAFFKPKVPENTYSIGLFHALFLLTKRESEFLIFSFINIVSLDAMAFIVFSLFIIEWRWEWMALFCKFDYSSNLTFSLASGYALMFIFKFIEDTI